MTLKMEEKYITLKIPDTDMEVVVKLDYEGIVVDVFGGEEGDDVIATTWQMYSDLGVDLIYMEEDGE